MTENFPNIEEMDIEEFEDYLSNRHKRKRSRTPTQIVKVSPKCIELNDLEKRLEVAKKQAEEAQRDDCTVLVQRLHIKADERDVYNFFAAAGVGKVRDVEVIRDPKTKKSKGVAYVEFYTPDSVLKSMTLSGQYINGQAIMVQPSQAEKNRAAAAARMAKAAEQQFTLPKEGPNKIYVAGFAEEVDKVGARELRQLFSPFGEIEHVEMGRGVGYIQYKRGRDAKEAVKKMNAIKIKGKKLKVGMADTRASIKEAQRIGDHEEDGTYIRSKGQKTQLMQKLARETDLEGLPKGIVSPVPTNVVLLTNLWDHKELGLTENPSLFSKIYDQVMDESRKHGRVEKLFVEKHSQTGNVWIKFEDLNSAQRAQATMHLRYFRGRKVKALFVAEATMKAHMS